MIRFTIMSLQPGIATITFVLQAMHSLTFGATHLGAMAALAALAPLGRPAAGRRASTARSPRSRRAVATIVSGHDLPEAGAVVFAAMAPLRRQSGSR